MLKPGIRTFQLCHFFQLTARLAGILLSHYEKTGAEGDVGHLYTAMTISFFISLSSEILFSVLILEVAI